MIKFIAFTQLVACTAIAHRIGVIEAATGATVMHFIALALSIALSAILISLAYPMRRDKMQAPWHVINAPEAPKRNKG